MDRVRSRVKYTLFCNSASKTPYPAYLFFDCACPIFWRLPLFQRNTGIDIRVLKALVKISRILQQKIQKKKCDRQARVIYFHLAVACYMNFTG
jgi:hypothetical protein